MIPVTGEVCGCVESVYGDYWISRLQRLSHKYQNQFKKIFLFFGRTTFFGFCIEELVARLADIELWEDVNSIGESQISNSFAAQNQYFESFHSPFDFAVIDFVYLNLVCSAIPLTTLSLLPLS